ncbi:YbaN family protein [Agrobacterium vitis]|uniref:YbaN family protein n=1 Tax=Agrobacterium vitis TaxID=373 RepID=A0AAE2RJK8_AGRVI|nr:YbaN family protein [Agrobacterium vitis]MBF2717682.1 YbaN family protein [Agrobacterium vitis]MVA22623.1 DUF454 family protein [Agrobacterium vitis]
MAELRASRRTLIETSRRHSIRAIYLTLGITMLILGFVGMLLPILPIMPTTILLILAAWFFGRWSPRLEARLLNHPRFGQTLRNWRDEGAVSARIKAVAVIGMVGGFIIFCVTAFPGPRLAIPMGILIVGSAVFILTQPAPMANVVLLKKEQP